PVFLPRDAIIEIEDRMSSWKFIFILHNLAIEEPLENEFIAIVPKTDQRVTDLINKKKTLNNLVNRFTDQFKRPVDPAILIVSNDAPQSVLDNEALVAFRNIFAINSIIESWVTFLNRRWQIGSLNYSNYFDIYPISPDKDYKYLITRSPSIHGLDESKTFFGQTSPELATVRSKINHDSEIINELLERWNQRYVKCKTRDWTTRVLFRSLEMAYQASSIPFKNNSTIYDYGSNLSLWVSAFEVMVHPKNGRADLTRVLNLIERIEFIATSLNKKMYRIPYPGKKGKRKGVTLPQKLYYQIYSARNGFLHGNPVRFRDLFPFCIKGRYPLTLYAPLLYKVALKCFLDILENVTELNGLLTEQYIRLRNLEGAIFSSLKEAKR
ncbi:hypothetical protein KA005_69610, partial [bacterium]|nr:hypothetical protein [bacterium]